MNEFNVPSTIVCGDDASGQLAEQLTRLGVTRALIVSDEFLVSAGVVDRVAAPLSSAGIECRVFADVQPEPVDRNVVEGLEVSKDFDAQAMVGLGGGSPMDVAKVIAIMSTHERPLAEYKGYHRFERPGLPTIAIPTTAGTGSEATKVVVITDETSHEKMMFLDRNLVPDVALVDYRLSMSMPPALTAHVGVDTLTHGIEAYVSRKANALTDPLARSCITLCAGFLLAAYDDPDNVEAREAMMTAALQGGMAFANSSVCLVHGMSRPIGANFHVPHGLSNAVLLPEITRFSLSGAPGRYGEIARLVGAAQESDNEEAAGLKLVDFLFSLNDRLNVGRVREAVKVSRSDYEGVLSKMAKDALASGSPQNNPVVPDKVEMVKLYQRVW